MKRTVKHSGRQYEIEITRRVAECYRVIDSPLSGFVRKHLGLPPIGGSRRVRIGFDEQAGLVLALGPNFSSAEPWKTLYDAHYKAAHGG